MNLVDTFGNLVYVLLKGFAIGQRAIDTNYRRDQPQNRGINLGERVLLGPSRSQR